MGIAHSPRIETKNLKFALDMGPNPGVNKSWKGKPTTNLGNIGLVGMSGISLSYIGMEDGWKKYSMNGTFTGGTYPYIMHISSIAFTGGVTYSSACYLKTNVPGKFNYFGNGMNYVNVPMNKGGTSIGTQQSDGSWYTARINFEYTSNTTQPGYILSNPINNTTFSSATDFVWIKEGQVEQNDFATPFAGDGATRSNTQSLLDWTNNAQITTNNLTYNTDNTFSFNGSTNFVTATWPGIFDLYCLDFWAYNNNTIPGNDGAIGGPSTYQSLIGFKNVSTIGVNLGGWTSSAVNEAIHIWTGNIAIAGMTYTRDTVPVGWHNIVFNWNGSQYDIWVDGQKSVTYAATFGHAPLQTMDLAVIGKNSQSNYFFHGRIGSVKMYDGQLSDNEIKRNFEAIRGRYGI